MYRVTLNTRDSEMRLVVIPVLQMSMLIKFLDVVTAPRSPLTART